MNVVSDPVQLNRAFGIERRVSFDTSRGGLTRAVLSGDGGRGELYLLGAHVSGYAPAQGEEVMFLSQLSHFREGQPIRGGVPICFPWFAQHPSDPAAAMHGNVRTRLWRVLESWERDGSAGLAMGIETDGLAVRYEVVVGGELTMRMHVRNTSEQAQQYQQALHTYFRVGDIEQVTIEGLGGGRYFDKVAQAEKVQEDDLLSFAGHTDRVYQDTAEEYAIHDGALARVIRIRKQNARSTVVWNPWAEKAGSLDDLGDDEWRRMVCVEAGNVIERAVELEPGASHSMSKRIDVHEM